MRIGWTAAAALVVAAAPVTAAPRGVRTITYQTGPCFGTCPAYRVEVRSDGSGRFEGMRFTAVQGVRTFEVTPVQWSAFEHRLAFAHGHGSVDLTRPPLCREVATDMASVDIRWSGAQRPFALHASYGCDRERNRKLFARLRAAPEVLPLAELIGAR